jgi:hypothetical protein
MAAAQPRKKTLRRVHSAAKTGNLRAALGKSWAMVLQRACAGGDFCRCAPPSGELPPGASLRNQCYEPAVRAAGCPDSRIGAVSGRTGIFDHDFVIGSS